MGVRVSPRPQLDFSVFLCIIFFRLTAVAVMITARCRVVLWHHRNKRKVACLVKKKINWMFWINLYLLSGCVAVLGWYANPLLGVVIIVISLFHPAMYLALGWTVRKIASWEKKKFFIFPTEGQIIPIVRGVSSGTDKDRGDARSDTSKTGGARSGVFDHFVISIRGHVMVGNKLVKLPDNEEAPRSFWNLHFGVEWIGLWQTVQTYHFKWNTLKWNAETEEAEIFPRDEIVSSLFWRAQYAFLIVEVEDKNNLRLTLKVLVNLRTVNPYQTLYGTSGKPGDWIQAVAAAITAVIRDFVGKESYESLIGMQTEGDNSPFIRAIKTLNTKCLNGNDSLEDLYGQVIDSANMISVELSDEDMREITQEKYRAEQKKLAAEQDAVRTITLGTAEATVRQKNLEAEAAGKKAMLKAEAAGTKAVLEATAAGYEKIGTAADGKGASMFAASKLSETKGTLVLDKDTIGLNLNQ